MAAVAPFYAGTFSSDVSPAELLAFLIPEAATRRTHARCYVACGEDGESLGYAVIVTHAVLAPELLKKDDREFKKRPLKVCAVGDVHPPRPSKWRTEGEDGGGVVYVDTPGEEVGVRKKTAVTFRYQAVDCGVASLTGKAPAELVDILARAAATGVERLVLKSRTLEEAREAACLASLMPGCLFFTAGLHPQEVTTEGEEPLSALEELCTMAGCVGVGECGIDLSQEGAELSPFHKKLLRHQVELANRLQKPLLVSEKNAHAQVLEVLGEFGDKLPPVAILTHTVDDGDLDAYVDKGFYLVVTGHAWRGYPVLSQLRKFLRENRREAVLQRLLLASEGPDGHVSFINQFTRRRKFVRRFNKEECDHLTSQTINLIEKHCGEGRSEPCCLAAVIELASGCCGLDPATFALKCKENAERFFKLDPLPRKPDWKEQLVFAEEKTVGKDDFSQEQSETLQEDSPAMEKTGSEDQKPSEEMATSSGEDPKLETTSVEGEDQPHMASEITAADSLSAAELQGPKTEVLQLKEILSAITAAMTGGDVEVIKENIILPDGLVEAKDVVSKETSLPTIAETDEDGSSSDHEMETALGGDASAENNDVRASSRERAPMKVNDTETAIQPGEQDMANDDDKENITTDIAEVTGTAEAMAKQKAVKRVTFLEQEVTALEGINEEDEEEIDDLCGAAELSGKENLAVLHSDDCGLNENSIRASDIEEETNSVTESTAGDNNFIADCTMSKTNTESTEKEEHDLEETSQSLKETPTLKKEDTTDSQAEEEARRSPDTPEEGLTAVIKENKAGDCTPDSMPLAHEGMPTRLEGVPSVPNGMAPRLGGTLGLEEERDAGQEDTPDEGSPNRKGGKRSGMRRRRGDGTIVARRSSPTPQCPPTSDVTSLLQSELEVEMYQEQTTPPQDSRQDEERQRLGLPSDLDKKPCQSEQDEGAPSTSSAVGSRPPACRSDHAESSVSCEDVHAPPFLTASYPTEGGNSHSGLPTILVTPSEDCLGQDELTEQRETPTNTEGQRKGLARDTDWKSLMSQVLKDVVENADTSYEREEDRLVQQDVQQVQPSAEACSMPETSHGRQAVTGTEAVAAATKGSAPGTDVSKSPSGGFDPHEDDVIASNADNKEKPKEGEQEEVDDWKKALALRRQKLVHRSFVEPSPISDITTVALESHAMWKRESVIPAKGSKDNPLVTRCQIVTAGTPFQEALRRMKEKVAESTGTVLPKVCRPSKMTKDDHKPQTIPVRLSKDQTKKDITVPKSPSRPKETKATLEVFSCDEGNPIFHVAFHRKQDFETRIHEGSFNFKSAVQKIETVQEENEEVTVQTGNVMKAGNQEDEDVTWKSPKSEEEPSVRIRVSTFNALTEISTHVLKEETSKSEGDSTKNIKPPSDNKQNADTIKSKQEAINKDVPLQHEPKNKIKTFHDGDNDLVDAQTTKEKTIIEGTGEEASTLSAETSLLRPNVCSVVEEIERQTKKEIEGDRDMEGVQKTCLHKDVASPASRRRDSIMAGHSFTRDLGPYLSKPVPAAASPTPMTKSPSPTTKIRSPLIPSNFETKRPLPSAPSSSPNLPRSLPRDQRLEYFRSRRGVDVKGSEERHLPVCPGLCRQVAQKGKDGARFRPERRNVSGTAHCIARSSGKEIDELQTPKLKVRNMPTIRQADEPKTATKNDPMFLEVRQKVTFFSKWLESKMRKNIRLHSGTSPVQTESKLRQGREALPVRVTYPGRRGITGSSQGNAWVDGGEVDGDRDLKVTANWSSVKVLKDEKTYVVTPTRKLTPSHGDSLVTVPDKQAREKPDRQRATMDAETRLKEDEMESKATTGVADAAEKTEEREKPTLERLSRDQDDDNFRRVCVRSLAGRLESGEIKLQGCPQSPHWRASSHSPERDSEKEQTASPPRRATSVPLRIASPQPHPPAPKHSSSKRNLPNAQHPSSKPSPPQPALARPRKASPMRQTPLAHLETSPLSEKEMRRGQDSQEEDEDEVWEDLREIPDDHWSPHGFVSDSETSLDIATLSENDRHTFIKAGDRCQELLNELVRSDIAARHSEAIALLQQAINKMQQDLSSTNPCPSASAAFPLHETVQSLGSRGDRPCCTGCLEALLREKTLSNQPSVAQEESAEKEAVMPALYLLTTTSIPFALTYIIRLLWPLLLQYLG